MKIPINLNHNIFHPEPETISSFNKKKAHETKHQFEFFP